MDINNAVIINLATEKRAVSDKDGNFMIEAAAGQELRFTKPDLKELRIGFQQRILQSQSVSF